MLRERDRKILVEISDRVAAARRPIAHLGLPIEPTWSMGIAMDGALVVQELYCPHDTEDAVAKGWKKISDRANPEELTLYLSIEPSSEYGRIPPVTETIRHTGIRRVIIGALNPFQRMQGKGIAALRGYGIDVVLADGEEARKCQVLYEDFAKVMNRHVPRWHLLASLENNDGRYLAKPFTGSNANFFTNYDGVLVDVQSLFKGDISWREGEWLIVLDAEAALPFDHKVIKKNIDRTLVFIGKEASAKRAVFEKKGLRTEVSTEKAGVLDLATVLRKLRDLGFFSIYSVDGAGLWKSAVHSGLVDLLGCFVNHSYDSGKILSAVEKNPIEFHLDKTEQNLQYFRLLQSKLVTKSENNFWMESIIQEI